MAFIDYYRQASYNSKKYEQIKDLIMPATLNLSLTNELRSFVGSNCGDGTEYSTPSDFLRDLIREKKARIEAADLRAAVIEGYQDAIAGRTITFNCSIQDALDEFTKREKDCNLNSFNLKEHSFANY